MSSAPLALDATDLRLLALLQEDASLSNLELAERAHISPPTCLRRIRRLRENGVILRTIALVRPEAAGLALTAVVEITLETQTAERLEAFETRCLAEPAVQQCYRLASGPDFMLVLQLADMNDYHAAVHRLSAQAGVRNLRTFFSTKRVKFETALPLQQRRPVGEPHR